MYGKYELGVIACAVQLGAWVEEGCLTREFEDYREEG